MFTPQPQHTDLRWEFEQSESLDAMGFSFDDADELDNHLGNSFDGLIEGHGINPPAMKRPDPSIVSGGALSGEHMECDCDGVVRTCSCTLAHLTLLTNPPRLLLIERFADADHGK